jgi:hypothetical protein
LSLTRFVSIPEIRDRLRAEFPITITIAKAKLVAPPLTKNYTVVGTAFDYLLRFLVERLNPRCHTERWVAETAVEETFPLITRDASVRRKAQALLDEAKRAHQEYMVEGVISDNFIRAGIDLAYLDFAFRGGQPHPNMGEVERADMNDLKRLLQIAPMPSFVAKQICILNPTFGYGSSLVGGADADLLIDGNLIDVKTTQKMKVEKRHIDQLVGYYLLSRIGGMVGDVKGQEIDKLSVYFSRHGQSVSFSTDIIRKNPHLKKVMEWFVDEVQKAFPQDRVWNLDRQTQVDTRRAGRA